MAIPHSSTTTHPRPPLVDGDRSSTLHRNGLQPKASFSALASLVRTFQVKPDLLGIGQGDLGCGRVRSHPDRLLGHLRGRKAAAHPCSTMPLLLASVAW